MTTPAPARWRFNVYDRFGNVADVWADHVFDNEDGLVFRRGPKGLTKIVANYAPASWSHYLMTEDHPEVDFDQPR